MQRFRTKYKRFFLALFNKILKSNNICKRIILILLSFCIIDLIILNSNFYIFKIPHFVFILCGCILLFIVTLFKKIDTNNNKRLKKRKNYSELIATFILVFFTGYLLFINDCYSDFTKRKGMDFVSSDKLESLRNIEDFLINEKQIYSKLKDMEYFKNEKNTVLGCEIESRALSYSIENGVCTVDGKYFLTDKEIVRQNIIFED